MSVFRSFVLNNADYDHNIDNYNNDDDGNVAAAAADDDDDKCLETPPHHLLWKPDICYYIKHICL